jgi:hypothetical protein
LHLFHTTNIPSKVPQGRASTCNLTFNLNAARLSLFWPCERYIPARQPKKMASITIKTKEQQHHNFDEKSKTTETTTYTTTTAAAMATQPQQSFTTITICKIYSIC